MPLTFFVQFLSLFSCYKFDLENTEYLHAKITPKASCYIIIAVLGEDAVWFFPPANERMRIRIFQVYIKIEHRTHEVLPV